MIKKFNPFATHNGYPTTDARIMPESDWHRDLMLQLIETLKSHFADDPNVYVSGDLLVHYFRDDRRRHVSPDVFMVRGVPKGQRPNYLVWEEGPPHVVIEVASATTHSKDTGRKFKLYRDVLKVKEYFLFDAKEDHLTPSMQGYRLVDGQYRSIRPKDGRLPSRVLDLHLERDGWQLRFWNPATGRWIPTDAERADEERRRADEEQRRADEVQRRANEERKARIAAEAEVARLRELLARQTRHANGKNGH